VIEILAEGLAEGANIAAKIALSEHLIQMRLRGPQTAMNALADVLAFAGFGIAAYIDADHPRLGSTANNLISFPGHNVS
jgi:hypothetical protein